VVFQKHGFYNCTLLTLYNHLFDYLLIAWHFRLFPIFKNIINSTASNILIHKSVSASLMIPLDGSSQKENYWVKGHKFSWLLVKTVKLLSWRFLPSYTPQCRLQHVHPKFIFTGFVFNCGKLIKGRCQCIKVINFIYLIKINLDYLQIPKHYFFIKNFHKWNILKKHNIKKANIKNMWTRQYINRNNLFQILMRLLLKIHILWQFVDFFLIWKWYYILSFLF
jgi:hypothetical protein